MDPITIDRCLIDSIGNRIGSDVEDADLLGAVRNDCPAASLREISRAALYMSTDPFPADVALSKRLYDFAVHVRGIA